MNDVIIIVIIVSVVMLMVIVINRTLINLCKRLPCSNCSTAFDTLFVVQVYAGWRIPFWYVASSSTVQISFPVHCKSTAYCKSIAYCKSTACVK